MLLILDMLLIFCILRCHSILKKNQKNNNKRTFLAGKRLPLLEPADLQREQRTQQGAGL